MNRKQRPQNGPGNNGLRGGTKTYCTKTFNGNFIDDVGGPANFKRGFHVEDYMTEQQNQQMGRTLKFEPLYGAALPREEDLISKSSTDIFKCVNYTIIDFLITESSLKYFFFINILQPKDWNEIIRVENKYAVDSYLHASSGFSFSDLCVRKFALS